MTQHIRHFLMVLLPALVLSSFAQQSVGELEKIALHSTKQELISSLHQAYQGGRDSTELARIEALLACREGRIPQANKWYNSLSKRDQRRFENQFLGALFAINGYRMDEASDLLAHIEKVRLKDDSSIANRDALNHLYEQVERLLGNTREAIVLDTLSGSLESILNHVQQNNLHLGRIDAETYTTPDGQTMWRVSHTEGEAPKFVVIHRLGDGSWDETNSDTIEVRGVPEGAELSYPRLMADGNTLYFVIEEPGMLPENGLGGKDVFVSRYDRAAGVLLVPQLLPPPFNSPADDYIYLTDEANDLGWLVTSRGQTSDSAHLYIFKLSSVKKYGGDDIVGAALWSHPMVTKEEVSITRPIGKEGDKNPKKVFFWLKNRPIRGDTDLQKESSKRLFAQYLKSEKALQELNEKLSALRARYAEEPRMRERLEGDIINMEQMLEDLRAQTRALCNEVIKEEEGIK